MSGIETGPNIPGASNEIDTTQEVSISVFDKFKDRAGLAAICTIPPADLALSDLATIKLYQIMGDTVDTSTLVGRGIQGAVVGGALVAQAVVLGQIISKTERLKGAFGDYDHYVDKKRTKMSKPRLALSKTVTSPFWVFDKIGKGFGYVGEKINTRKSKHAKAIGHIALDTGKVNAIGTTGVAMQETADGDPPDLRRNIRLASLFAVTWLLGAEAIRQVTDNFKPAEKAMNALGDGFEALTSIDFEHPKNSPLAIATMGTALVLFAASGYKFAKYHEEHDANSLEDTKANESEKD